MNLLYANILHILTEVLEHLNITYQSFIVLFMFGDKCLYKNYFASVKMMSLILSKGAISSIQKNFWNFAYAFYLSFKITYHACIVFLIMLSNKYLYATIFVWVKMISLI